MPNIQFEDPTTFLTIVSIDKKFRQGTRADISAQLWTFFTENPGQLES
jgi:hypothetical protein